MSTKRNIDSCDVDEAETSRIKLGKDNLVKSTEVVSQKNQEHSLVKKGTVAQQDHLEPANTGSSDSECPKQNCKTRLVSYLGEDTTGTSLPTSYVMDGHGNPPQDSQGGSIRPNVDPEHFSLVDIIQYYTGAPLQYMPSYSPLTPPDSPRKRKHSETSDSEDLLGDMRAEKIVRTENKSKVEMSLLYPDVE